MYPFIRARQKQTRTFLEEEWLVNNANIYHFDKGAVMADVNSDGRLDFVNRMNLNQILIGTGNLFEYRDKWIADDPVQLLRRRYSVWLR